MPGQMIGQLSLAYNFIVTIFTDKKPVVMDSLGVLLQFKLTDKLTLQDSHEIPQHAIN